MYYWKIWINFRSEKSLYKKLDASVQTDGADFADKDTQTDEGDLPTVSKSEKGEGEKIFQPISGKVAHPF